MKEKKRMREKFSLYIHLIMVFISKIYEELLKISKKKTILCHENGQNETDGNYQVLDVPQVRFSKTVGR